MSKSTKKRNIVQKAASKRSKPSPRRAARAFRRKIAKEGDPNFIDLTVTAGGESQREGVPLTWDRLFVNGKDHLGQAMDAIKAFRLSCVAGEQAVMEVERYAQDKRPFPRTGADSDHVPTEIVKYPIRRFSAETLKGGCFLDGSDVWTEDTPTQEGWYWFNNGEPELTQLLHVWSSCMEPDDDSLMTNGSGFPDIKDPRYKDGLWCGPIPLKPPPLAVDTAC